MFEIALAIGIFSYSIYFIGLAGFLYRPVIILFSLLFWLGFLFYKGEALETFLKHFSLRHLPIIVYAGIFFIVLQALINSIGLFGPEIGFDATWYHLTLPKLYLFYHTVIYFPGYILDYSNLPKFAEMLFTAGLSFGSDFFARGVQFVFGLLTCIVLYKIGRKFLSPNWSILIPVIFYSNLVVGWESISGYIDLVRTFYAAIAFLAFLQWLETKKQKYFIYSALFVGFTIATKLLALPDIGIYALALLLFTQTTFQKKIQSLILFTVIIVACCLPYFLFAFIHTGNPIYPMLSSAYRLPTYWQILNPLYLVASIWQTFAYSSDPITPIFLAAAPFFFLYGKLLGKKVSVLVYFSIAGLVAWYITPQTGGGRYILPYLSVLSVLSIYLISQLSQKWQRFFILFICLIAMVSLVYRGVANAKFLPLFFHKETKAAFMSKHLQFNLGDFYDIDGYFAHHIKPSDTVLLYGFHNLYYVDFNFIDSDWVKKGDAFDYVAVQGTGMPERFRYWSLVYFNSTTQVRLYSLKGQTWYY